MLSVVMLNVVMQNVVAPVKVPNSPNVIETLETFDF